MQQNTIQKKSLKAQFWSFDVIFALVIFGVAITILTFTWYNITNQLSISSGNGAMILEIQTKAFASSILSPGSPQNWQSIVNTTDAASWGNVSIGLLSSGSNISSSKLYAMMAMSNNDYVATKQPLGMAFDYYIVISSSPSDGAGLNIKIGKDPQANKALTTYVEKRSAFIDGVPVSIKMMVWTNTTLATS